LIKKIQEWLNHNRLFYTFISILAFLLVAFTISSFAMNSRKEATTIKYNAALQQYNDMNAKMKAENIKAFEKTLRASFSDSQLIKIAQHDTNYSLSINGDPIGKNTSTVYAERPTIAVLISENYGRTELDNLPRSIIEMGSVIELKSSSSLVKITSGNATIKTKLYNFYYGKTLSYVISGLKAGDIVTLEILPSVAKKIGLDDNIIEVFYNKDFTEVS